MPSLYRRLLGDRFDDLPEVLKRFHDAPEGGRVRGAFRIERAPGRLRNAVASLLGLPESGDEVPVSLQVVVDGDRERWVRQLGTRRVETVEWARGGLLMESLGPTAFACELIVDGSSVINDFRRAWFVGIPLPRWLSPVVDGRVDAGESGWRVAVRIVAPWLGELVRYEGWVEPE